MDAWTFWLIAAAVLFALELFAGTVYLLVLSAALCGAALAEWLFGLGWQGSLLAAAVLSLLGVAWVWRLRKAARAVRVESDAAANDLDIGALVLLQTPLAGGLWRVEYRGSIWEAQIVSGAATAGAAARIRAKNGNVLLLEMV